VVGSDAVVTPDDRLAGGISARIRLAI